MPLEVSDLVAQCESHLMRSGLFDRVNWHEPKSSPGVGVTAATWFTATTPVRSGLVSTTVRVELLVRMYMPMLREPMDDIDPAMMRALDVLMRQYSGDFTLGGEVRNVDLLGEHGTPLQARSGYLRVDSTLYRVVDITLPLIVNDLWEQAP